MLRCHPSQHRRSLFRRFGTAHPKRIKTIYGAALRLNFTAHAPSHPFFLIAPRTQQTSLFHEAQHLSQKLAHSHHTPRIHKRSS